LGKILVLIQPLNPEGAKGGDGGGEDLTALGAENINVDFLW